MVWYLIEFAEDLHHRLTGQDIFFRAVLTTGSFTHYNLQNIECFFGEALINAYLREKEIPSIGLFIDTKCNEHNKYFRTEPFDRELLFVYLNRSLESLNEYTGGNFPVTDPTVADQSPYAPWQVRFLKDVHEHMRTHPLPQVRVKFLTAWDLYKRRYGNMLTALEQGNFALTALAGGQGWASEQSAMEKDIRHYKRIGSGSNLSLQLTRNKRRSAPPTSVS